MKTRAQQYGTFRDRFLASLVDSLILGVGVWFLNFIDESGKAGFIVKHLIEALIFAIYFINYHANSGQTPGKLLLGIRVVHVSETRGITYFEAIKRDGLLTIIEIIILFYLAGKAISGADFANVAHTYGNVFGVISIAWVVLELITIFTNDKRRAFHDYLGNSVVIKTEN